MVTVGSVILSVVSFLTVPTWHLVVFFIIILVFVGWNLYNQWIVKNKA